MAAAIVAGALIATLSLLVLASGLLGSNHPAPVAVEAGPPLTNPLGPLPTSTPATTTPDPTQPLAAGLPPATDIGALWTGGSRTSVSQPSATSGCGSSLWATNTAELDEQYVWQDMGQTAHASMSISVMQAASAADTVGQVAFVNSAQDAACVMPMVAADAGRRWSFLGPTSWTVESAPFRLSMAGGARLLSASRLTPDGLWTVWYFIVHQFKGPYETSALMTWCSCEAVPVQHLVNLVDAIDAGLVRLTGGGPWQPPQPFALPTVTAITKDTDPGFPRAHVVHLDWGQLAHSPAWAVQDATGSFSSPQPPPSTDIDYASSSQLPRYRAIACPIGCATNTLPDPTVGPGMVGPYVVGPWLSFSVS